MRFEVIRKHSRWILTALIGISAGRFLVPRLESKTIHYVTIFPDEETKQCHYAMVAITSILGRTTQYGEGYFHLDCRQELTIADTVIDCRCDSSR